MTKKQEPTTRLVTAHELTTSEFAGRFYEPLGRPPHYGVLVVHGSDPTSEFPDTYARHLALHGYATLRITYFNAPPGPAEFGEVPLSQFDAALDWLAAKETVHTDHFGVVGWSRGTEAVFHIAARDDRISAIIGYSPSAYVFPGLTESDAEVSAWSAHGDPLPYVPSYDGIEEDENEPPLVRFRRTVDRASAATLRRAALPVEDINGPVLLITGAEDKIWPGTDFAATLMDRLDEQDRPWADAHHIYNDAGHAIAVPYQPVSDEVLEMMGGTGAGTVYAATDAWEHALACLRQGVRERA